VCACVRPHSQICKMPCKMFSWMGSLVGSPQRRAEGIRGGASRPHAREGGDQAIIKDVIFCIEQAGPCCLFAVADGLRNAPCVSRGYSEIFPEIVRVVPKPFQERRCRGTRAAATVERAPKEGFYGDSRIEGLTARGGRQLLHGSIRLATLPGQDSLRVASHRTIPLDGKVSPQGRVANDCMVPSDGIESLLHKDSLRVASHCTVP